MLESISKKLLGMLNRTGIGPQVEAAMVCAKFDEVVRARWGAAMRDKVKAVSLEHGLLTIASLYSVISQEIKLHQEELIEELNGSFESKPVKGFKFIT